MTFVTNVTVMLWANMYHTNQYKHDTKEAIT